MTRSRTVPWKVSKTAASGGVLPGTRKIAIRAGVPGRATLAPRVVTTAHMTGDPRLDRARGALLGTFVGDALGMPYEGAPPTAVPEHLEMLDARLGRGTYTDDTQMAIALAESLLEVDGIDEEHIGRAFLAAYDPKRGYGSGTRAVLNLIAQGVAAVDAAARVFDGLGSLGNGAAMRVAPIAVRYAFDEQALLDAARRSARVTHAHPVGVDATVVQAAAVGAALRGADPLEAARAATATPQLRERLAHAVALLTERPAPGEVATALGNSPTATESVPTAIYAATAHARFEYAVSFAVRCAGDSDTIGAMAGAIAGARDGASAIPVRWRDSLEDGPKGRSHVERLAELLADRR
jgi:poly(ADP-ribose) glycohydrolase ARH3